MQSPASGVPDVRAFDGRRVLRGRLRPVGDKSISHRALMFSALARGTSTITGANPGADVRATAAALRALGVDLRSDGDDRHVVRGRGRRWRPATGAIDCGNSGTTMRLLAGILAGQPFTTTLDGDASLRQRPMGRIARPLRTLGARVEGPTNGERAPLVVTGTALRGGRFALDIASAQVKSCILLAGWVGGVEVEVTEPGPSRDHTERMLAERGVDLDFGPGHVRLRPGDEWAALDVEVPGDPSAAALLAAAALVVPGSEVRIEEVLTNPTRTAFVPVLARMGALVHWEDEARRGGETVATLCVRAGAQLRPVRVTAEEIPRLIDEVPALAALASLSPGATSFEGIGELRVKETDRIAALEDLLGRFGVRTESGREHLVVHGGSLRRPVSALPASADHRLAMVSVALGLAVGARDGGEPIEVDLASASVSDPGFAARIQRLQAPGS